MGTDSGADDAELGADCWAFGGPPGLTGALTDADSILAFLDGECFEALALRRLFLVHSLSSRREPLSPPRGEEDEDEDEEEETRAVVDVRPEVEDGVGVDDVEEDDDEEDEEEDDARRDRSDGR